MKRTMCVLLLLLFLIVADFAAAESQITVQGEGTCVVSADRALITIGVQERNDDVKLAQNCANGKIASIRETLLANGVQETEISTGRIYIFAENEYSEEKGNTIVYCASLYLTICVSDMECIGKMIDSCFDAGANSLENIVFSASDTTEAREMAIRSAMNDAAIQANIIAEEANLKLGIIKSVSQNGIYTYEENGRMAAKQSVSDNSSVPTVVQAAGICVSVNLNVTYQAE